MFGGKEMKLKLLPFLLFLCFIFSLNVYSQSSYILYIDASSNTIQRINNVGTGGTTIYTQASGLFLNSLAVDVSLSKVYFYVDDNNTYTSGKIYTCNLDGTNLTQFLDVSSVGGIDGLAAGGGDLYYTPYNSGTSGTIVKINSDKSTSSTIYTSTGGYILNMALDIPDNLLFFQEDISNSYTINKCDLSGNSKSQIYSSGGFIIQPLAAGNGYVFFATGGNSNLQRITSSGGSLTTVYAVSSGSIYDAAYDLSNKNLFFYYSPDIYNSNSDASSISSLVNIGNISMPSAGYNSMAAAPNTVLPVELTTFSANNLGDKVELNWNTATEVNNYGFNVERKTENGEWTNIGFVKGSGNSNSPKNYSFIDGNPLSGKVEYRLKQIDNDGSFKYSSIVTVNSLPIQFNLAQNYPNPFNPTTTIQYAIPKAEHVTLKVYDELGNEVTTLVNENKVAGQYKVSFNGSNLASGIYYYRIAAGDFTEVKKLMLLK